MSAALSLLDDDPFDERTPAVPALASVPIPAEVEAQAVRAAMDPDMLRDRDTFAQALRPGGITVTLLSVSTLVSSPAIYQCLVRGSISATTMLVRWVLITLGCWLVSEVARRYVVTARRSAQDTQDAAAAAAAQKADQFDDFGGYDGSGYDASAGFDGSAGYDGGAPMGSDLP
ncbi:hypothetical protein [Nocardioides sp.]|uniref:hypothetical protein n=1 Tax=Nocardioides sp. TaxID=35761 RepID=UPI002618DE5C|nr:hypothetical protein [Nocardioides sp.]